MLADLKENDKFFETHLDARARIDHREDCHLRMQAEKKDSLTMAEVDKRRR
jgi:hypothetical protein